MAVNSTSEDIVKKLQVTAFLVNDVLNGYCDQISTTCFVTPSGMPSGAPSGAPSSVPSGTPSGTPSGPPSSTSGAPSENVGGQMGIENLQTDTVKSSTGD